jgi:hypothetical protein
MAALIARVRADAPFGPLPLAVGPVSINYQPAIFRAHFAGDFVGAAADLDQKRGVQDSIRPDSIADAPVRKEATRDSFDVTTMLLVRFTPIGFDKDSTHAVLFLTLDCGPHCGSAVAAALRRRRDGWAVAEFFDFARP